MEIKFKPKIKLNHNTYVPEPQAEMTSSSKIISCVKRLFLGLALFSSIKISRQHIPLKDNKKHTFFINIKHYAKGLDVPKIDHR